MMKKFRIIKVKLFLIVIVCWFDVHATTDYSGKLSLRTGIGQLTNQGTQSGAAPTIGGFDLQYHYFLNSRLTAGFGYTSQFDLADNGVPVSGYELLGRFYFLHSGTREKSTENGWESSTHYQWSPYVGMFYGHRVYYLGPDNLSSDPVKQLTGTYGIINFTTGVDYRLDDKFELTGELSTSLATLVGADPRVKISETIIWMGLNYVF